MNNKSTKILSIIVFALIGVCSVVILFPLLSSVEFHAGSLNYLDEKIKDVMGLAASTTALSTALTFLPGDAASPIADQLAGYNTYFLVILCGVYLEKYLLTLTSYATFLFIIPFSCLMEILRKIFNKDNLAYFGRKLALFGLIIVLIVPVSVQASKIIDDTFQFSIDSISESADAIADTAEDIEEVPEDEKNWWGGVVDTVQNGFDSLTSGVTDTIEDAQSYLSRLIEGIAIMIITSCIIPILVFVTFGWVMKSMWGVQIDMSKFRGKHPKAAIDTKVPQELEFKE